MSLKTNREMQIEIRAGAEDDAQRTKRYGIDLNPYSTHGERILWQKGWDGIRPPNLVDTSIDWQYWERGRQANIIAKESGESDKLSESEMALQRPRDQERKMVLREPDSDTEQYLKQLGIDTCCEIAGEIGYWYSFVGAYAMTREQFVSELAKRLDGFDLKGRYPIESNRPRMIP